MGHKTDRHLIEACIRKDLAAWADLVKKYSPLVCLSIENRLKKYGISAARHDIEDINQNIFADIWKNNKLLSVTNRDDISYWVAVVSGNAAMEYFRSRSARQARKTISLFDKIEEKELSELLSSEALNPEDELARAETEAKIDEAIESLPEKEKLMMKLHLIHDKKYHEIAEILNIPNGTVSSYIKRAREKLKEALKDF